MYTSKPLESTKLLDSNNYCDHAENVFKEDMNAHKTEDMSRRHALKLSAQLEMGIIEVVQL